VRLSTDCRTDPLTPAELPRVQNAMCGVLLAHGDACQSCRHTASFVFRKAVIRLPGAERSTDVVCGTWHHNSLSWVCVKDDGPQGMLTWGLFNVRLSQIR